MTPCRTHSVLISPPVGELVQNRLAEHEGRVLEHKVKCFRAKNRSVWNPRPGKGRNLYVFIIRVAKIVSRPQ